MVDPRIAGTRALEGSKEAAEGERGLGLVSCWQLDANSSLLSNDMASFHAQKGGSDWAVTCA